MTTMTASPLWCPRLEGEGVGQKLSVAPLSPCSVVLPIRDTGQWQQATLSFLLPAGPCRDPISVPVASAQFYHLSKWNGQATFQVWILPLCVLESHLSVPQSPHL